MAPLVWPDMVARASSAETAPNAMAVYSGTDYVDPRQLPLAGLPLQPGRLLGRRLPLPEPELDKMLEDARASTDEARRKELYDAAQLKLVEDAVEIWVYTEIENDAWVAELGEPYDTIMGGDVRNIRFQG
jgi:ABC-type transport system substrate-binding protein